MNTFTRTLLVLLGVSLLVPALVLAQSAPPPAAEPAPVDPNTVHPPATTPVPAPAATETPDTTPAPAPATATVPATTGTATGATVQASSTTPKANVKANVNASTTPRNTTAVKLDAKLERAKLKASQEIERRITALYRLEDRINDMKRVSENFKADLATTINSEIAKLNALRVKIEASTNGEEIKTDVQSITRSYRIFALVMPKASIAAAADKIVRMSAVLSEIGAKLKARIDMAAAEGKDVTAMSAALTELAAKITSANTHAQAAVAGTATLTPDEGDKTKMEANKKALEAARAELKSAHEDIKAGRTLIKQILDGLKGIQGATSTPQGPGGQV